MKYNLLTLAFLLTVAIIFSACSDDNEGTDNNLTLKTAIQENYANIVYYNYLDAYNTAEALQAAVEDFVANPANTTKFQACKEAWLAARETYGTTEAFRFSGGPIDDEDGPEGLLNAWPLDEAYIDYVEGNADAGIINDPVNYPTIDQGLLESLNENGGEENISVGYHAIEFLLWGQDLTAPSEQLAGQRPNTDFVDGGTAANQDRRRAYLVACADLLVKHLALLVEEWDPAATGNYRTTFMEMDPDQALTKILTGIGVLSKSELAGERIFTAYDNQNQEDEHSCFSDNTHRDIRLNALGIQNVYTGTYERMNGETISGTSINDLVAAIDETVASEAVDQLHQAVNDVEATGIPFDLAITDTNERPQVLAAVNALRTLGDSFAQVGATLGLSINTSLPE